jgi:hypothetical protein
MYNPTFNDVPLTHLNGSTVDISVLLRFYVLHSVYYKISESSFPSESKQISTILYCVLLPQMMPICKLALLGGRLEPVMKLLS